MSNQKTFMGPSATTHVIRIMRSMIPLAHSWCAYSVFLWCLLISPALPAQGYQNTGAIAWSGDYLWVGSMDGVVRLNVNDGSLRRLRESDGLVSAPVFSIIATPAGVLWFATPEGISRHDETGWRSYTASNGLVSSKVNSIAMDASGSLWVATEGGISRYDGSGWESYTEADGLVLNNVRDVITDRTGAVWFLAESGLVRFDGATWTSYSLQNTPITGYVRLRGIDANGVRWFGDEFAVYRFDGAQWTTFALGSKGDDFTMVFSLKCDAEGNAWAGMAGLFGSLLRYDGEVWGYPCPSLGNVYAITIDANDGKWIDADGCLAHVDQEGCSRFEYPVDIRGSVYRNIATDDMGRVWTVYDDGVIMFDHGTWTNFPYDSLTRVEIVQSGNSGLVIFPSFPNPFNSSASIRFATPTAGAVTLAIYNTAGQKVRSITREVPSAGTHAFVWDGRDDHGDLVSSGMYLSRLQGNNMSVYGRMLFLK